MQAPDASTAPKPKSPSATSRGASRYGELHLCDAGLVSDADEATAELFGCGRDELIGLHVSRLLPKLTEATLSDASSCRRLAYLSHCGAVFNARRFDGASFACAIAFRQTDAATGRIRRLLVAEIDDLSTYRL